MCPDAVLDRVVLSSADGIVAFDVDGRCSLWTPAMERITAIATEQALDRPVFDLLSAGRDTDAASRLRDALVGKTSRFEHVRDSLPGARKACLEVHCSPLRGAEGRIVGGTAVVRDVTERKLAEEALRETEERYALAIRGTHDGLWDWNLVTDEVHFCSRWKVMLGFAEDEIGSDVGEWLGRVHPDDVPGLKAAIAAHLDGVSPRLRHEYRILHKDGTYRWMLGRGVAVRDAAAKALRMAGLQTDVTSRKVTEEQLLHDALHDPLTGLANRVLFMDRLRYTLARSLRQGGRTYAVVFLDLDRFKVVNDSLGHLAGDQLLIAAARRLETSVRPADTVARLSADEFAILLDDVRPGDVTLIAERIQTDVAAPFSLGGRDVFTSASMGIAMGSPDFERPEDVFRDAETAMYRAKALGKARHEIFATNMREHSTSLLDLETDLRRAVERREFRIHYQPIVSLDTGRTVGFESLARWHRSDGTVVQPADFLRVAEETGLMLPIGRWLMREACRQVRLWQARLYGNPRLAVTVNLSSRQLAAMDLSGEIEQILRETGLAAHDLRLEITEGVLMENTDTANAMLLRLKALGVRLYVDDFGTGYSSLSYLHSFPVDALKIDRSFMAKLGGEDENLEIVRTIISLAHNLGLEVVAEGVETREQLARLKELGCEYGQGFLFSHPLEVHAAASWIAQESRISVG